MEADNALTFRFLKSKLRTGALLLNHCITRPNNRTGVQFSTGPI
jgi:hypothetical protein